ncbi:signal peptidase II [Pseudarthrobacter sp. H3Y2-7]|uniref:signal peptidase II n=1 Tax=Pseudarthrobacter naphthalenicus TaxID=3031328 RepID=UPI0023AF4071|nr:signal peptidase II [Pseudarthrobacter sp. H3Y2-7]MDE8669994.1 signal peptidase II [Pseudarthrobacter sp. H3Y2-7]
MSTQSPASPSVTPPVVGTAKGTRIFLLIWAAVLATADLLIKSLAETLLSRGETVDLGPLNIRMLYNTGVAFSFGADLAPWLVTGATGTIILAMTWYALSTAPGMSGLSRAGAALTLGGGAGNFIDRLDGRGVVDYLHSGWFPTFNLADAFVTVGVGLYILGALRTSGLKTGD